MNMNYKEVYNKIIENFTALNIKYEITKNNNIVCPADKILIDSSYIFIFSNSRKNIIEFEYGKNSYNEPPEFEGYFDGTMQDFHKMLTCLIKFYFNRIDNSIDF